MRMDRKLEFEKIEDEWIATEFQWIHGIYHPINQVRGLSADDIINKLTANVKQGHRITIMGGV